MNLTFSIIDIVFDLKFGIYLHSAKVISGFVYLQKQVLQKKNRMGW